MHLLAGKELDKHLNGLLIAACDEEFIRQLWQRYLPMILLCMSARIGQALELTDGVLDELAETCRRIVAKSWLQVFQQGLLKNVR